MNVYKILKRVFSVQYKSLSFRSGRAFECVLCSHANTSTYCSPCAWVLAPPVGLLLILLFFLILDRHRLHFAADTGRSSISSRSGIGSGGIRSCGGTLHGSHTVSGWLRRRWTAGGAALRHWRCETRRWSGGWYTGAGAVAVEQEEEEEWRQVPALF